MRQIHSSLIPSGLRCFRNSQFALYPSEASIITGQLGTIPLPENIFSDPTVAADFCLRVKEKEIPYFAGKGIVLPIDDGTSAQEACKILTQCRAGNVGIRGIRLINENEIGVDVVDAVPHLLYMLTNCASDPNISVAGANLGSCVALLTTESDGVPYLVVQHRGKRNRVYAEVPGASAAGLIDALFLPESGPIDLLQLAIHNIHNEAKEELGLSLKNKVIFKAFAVDLGAVHSEMIFISRTQLSFAELRENALRNTKPDSPSAFRENFFGIRATRENLINLTLLSSPIPPTHWAAFAMLFQDLTKEEGCKPFQAFLKLIDNGARLINGLVWRETGMAYNPNISATEQGLPSVREEFQRVYGDGCQYVDVLGQR